MSFEYVYLGRVMVVFVVEIEKLLILHVGVAFEEACPSDFAKSLGGKFSTSQQGITLIPREKK